MPMQGDESTLLLTFLHNMGYVDESRAVEPNEISAALSLERCRVEEILKMLESDGYVASARRAGGGVCFYLTGKGVIRVCSIYT
ncbi:MAG: hypothetical protein RMJ28_03510 [Nitrososphaerota archaeon]|nr:hypothetical protein [Candidatus Calditenuaceae archaeon]MDW8073288.1 hypothetical protein [Nitrososphaerota archaeon]